MDNSNQASTRYTITAKVGLANWSRESHVIVHPSRCLPSQSDRGRKPLSRSKAGSLVELWLPALWEVRDLIFQPEVQCMRCWRQCEEEYVVELALCPDFSPTVRTVWTERLHSVSRVANCGIVPPYRPATSSFCTRTQPISCSSLTHWQTVRVLQRRLKVHVCR